MLQIGFRARSGNFLSFAETFNQALIFRTDMLCQDLSKARTFLAVPGSH